MLRFLHRQFLALFIPVAAVIIAVAFAFMDMRSNAQIKEMTTAERANLQQLSGYMSAEATTSINQLRALIREDEVIFAIDTPSPGTMTTLQSVFMTMAGRSPSFQQIRWIDETGIERVRVMRDAKGIFVVEDKQLQDKSDREYFNATKSLLTGEIYISDFDLNVGQERNAALARPTLRVATPVFDSSRRPRGILIINIAMQYMLDALRIVQETNTGTSYTVINSNGYGLSTPATQEQIGFEPEYPDIAFSGQHPLAWEHISSSDTGTAELDDGLWIWERLATEDIIRHLAFAEAGGNLEVPSIHMGGLSLKLAANISTRSLEELHQEARMTTMLGAILLLLAYAWGLVFFLRGQSMKRRADIEVARATAHAEHIERLKELEERFRLLVEASSVGMVVVDSEGNIIMNNSAAENMLGYPKGGLEGLHVDKLLPPDKRSQHARMRSGFMLNPEAREMGRDRKLEALTADGRRVPVEVGLNPFRDHGKQVVLASIIDLSRR